MFVFFSDLNDFNNTVLTIVFEADESGPRGGDLSVMVPVVDDDINEAIEQYFAVNLQVTDAVNPSGINLTGRPDSACIIVDNDGKVYKVYL